MSHSAVCGLNTLRTRALRATIGRLYHHFETKSIYIVPPQVTAAEKQLRSKTERLMIATCRERSSAAYLTMPSGYRFRERSSGVY